jgi:hypothetical protein
VAPRPRSATTIDPRWAIVVEVVKEVLAMVAWSSAPPG